MQMTESFATTVAAVAPVVWLAGAVEAHQAVKYLREKAEERRLWAEALARELESAEDQAVLARPWGERQPAGVWPAMALFVVWSTLSAALIVATALPLRWLTEGEGVPAPLVADFCYFTVCAGMLVVTMLPMAVMSLRMIRSGTRTAASLQAARQRRAAAEARLVAQRPGDHDPGEAGRT
ncbi:hypothetical protein [Streptomyces sp. NPDC007984]|uniref:hypothetical protein n=1 Tax=Streptomyces sp. NPDC007984 TaxID=3364801 RepID=UPI0036E3D798